MESAVKEPVLGVAKECQVCQGPLRGRQRGLCSRACWQRHIAVQGRTKTVHVHRYRCQDCGEIVRLGRPRRYP